jgi:hypothetical protein
MGDLLSPPSMTRVEPNSSVSPSARTNTGRHHGGARDQRLVDLHPSSGLATIDNAMMPLIDPPLLLSADADEGIPSTEKP